MILEPTFQQMLQKRDLSDCVQYKKLQLLMLYCCQNEAVKTKGYPRAIL